jgi:hypothetical protein
MRGEMVTCDKEFVALVRSAAALDVAAVLHKQQQSEGRQAEGIDEHANQAEADEREVAVAGAADLEVNIEPLLALVELPAAKALEDGLAHERI